MTPLEQTSRYQRALDFYKGSLFGPYNEYDENDRVIYSHYKNHDWYQYTYFEGIEVHYYRCYKSPPWKDIRFFNIICK